MRRALVLLLLFAVPLLMAPGAGGPGTAGWPSSGPQTPITGNVDYAGYDVTNGGDFAVGSITYDTAISTCADVSPWECGVQLLSMTSAPENADANTFRFYNVSGVPTIWGTSGTMGRIVRNNGTTVLDNGISVFDGTTGNLIKASGVTLSGGDLSGLTGISATGKLEASGGGVNASLRLSGVTGTPTGASADAVYVFAKNDRLYVDSEIGTPQLMALVPNWSVTGGLVVYGISDAGAANWGNGSELCAWGLTSSTDGGGGPALCVADSVLDWGVPSLGSASTATARACGTAITSGNHFQASCYAPAP